MKWYVILILSLSIIFSGCKTNHGETGIKCFDKDIYEPTYSSNFSINGNNESNDILISVYNPWQGAQNVISDLLIVRDSIKPVNYKGQLLKGNAERIVCMSSTHIAMLDALDAVDRIVGISGKQYVSNDKILASSKFIAEVGYEGNMDYETLVNIKPDLVLLFSVNGASSLEPKLKELNIPFIYIGDYVEESPLGKAEWLVPIAEIIGNREKGIEIFNNIVLRYEDLKNKIIENDLNYPKVMLNAPFNGSWYMPSSQSYVARMVADAGGDYVYKKNTGNSSLPIEKEEALLLVSQADVWLNIGSMNSLDEVKKNFPDFTTTNCILNGNLYNNNLRSSPGGGNDCYESGIVNPDLILRDLIKIFHPHLIEEDFVYYKHLE